MNTTDRAANVRQVDAEVLVAVPHHGWTIHVGPSGHLYAWNHYTKKSTWTIPSVHPKPPFVGFPPPVPKYEITIPPAEHVDKKYRLGRTKWWACYTNAENRFFYNRATKVSTWRPIPDLYPLIKLLDASLSASQSPPAFILPLFFSSSDGPTSPVEQSLDTKQDTQTHDGHVPDSPPLHKDDDEPQSPEIEHDLEDSQIAELEAELNALEEAQLMTNFDQDADEDQFNESDNEDLSFVDKVSIFLAQLNELNISPFATTDSISNLLPELNLSERERQDLFVRYCEDKIKERKSANLQSLNPKQAFLSLVADNRKLFWEDLKRMYRRDPRFTNYGKSDREREKVFREAKKMTPDQLKRLIADPSLPTVTAASKDHVKEAIRNREQQVQAQLSSARKHTNAVRHKANMDEARAVFTTLLVDYADDADFFARAKKDARFSRVVHLGLQPPDMKAMVRDYVRQVASASERMIRDRLTLHMASVPVCPKSGPELLAQCPWALEPSVVQSVGGRVQIDRIANAYLSERQAQVRNLAAEALLDAKSSIEAWVSDRLAENADPVEDAAGLGAVLASDPRWAAVDLYPKDRLLLLHTAIESAVHHLRDDGGGDAH